MNRLFSGNVAITRHPRHTLAALLLAGAALTSGVAAATTYQIVELPLPPDLLAWGIAISINNTGEIVGYGVRDDGDEHALAWSPAPDYSPRWLPDADESARATWAWGINDAGVIIGNEKSYDPTRDQAVMWGPNDVLIRLDVPPQVQTGNWAQDINTDGTVVGYSHDDFDSIPPFPTFWLRPMTARLFTDDYSGPLQFMQMEALNDSGTIVGRASFDGRPDRERAFRRTPGSGIQLLDELPGSNLDSHAYDVNEAGQAVGYDYNFNSPVNGSRAVLWNADGSVLDLGELPGGSAYDYVAFDINNAGVVTGSFFDPDVPANQTFSWTAATGMQNIVDLIDPLDPWYPQLQSRTAFIYINDLNDTGVVVGELLSGGLTIPIVLVPQP